MATVFASRDAAADAMVFSDTELDHVRTGVDDDAPGVTIATTRGGAAGGSTAQRAAHLIVAAVPNDALGAAPVEIAVSALLHHLRRRRHNGVRLAVTLFAFVPASGLMSRVMHAGGDQRLTAAASATDRCQSLRQRLLGEIANDTAFDNTVEIAVSIASLGSDTETAALCSTVLGAMANAAKCTVVVPKDAPPGVMSYFGGKVAATEWEARVRQLLAGSSPECGLSVLATPRPSPTTIAACNVVTAERPQPRKVFLCVLDSDAFMTCVPAAVEAAAGLALPGDAIVLHGAVAMPDAAVSTQLTDNDWADRLKANLVSANEQLGNVKTRVTARLKAADIFEVTVGRIVSDRPLMEGIAKSVASFGVTHLVVPANFKRPPSMVKGVHVALFGTGYEQILRQCRGLDAVSVMIR
jgi:hypothetical protein